MWSDNDGPFDGKYFHLAETLCSPDAARRSDLATSASAAERRRSSSARYADSCNVCGMDVESTERLLGILDEHCEREGRDPKSVERTVVTRFDPGATANAPTRRSNGSPGSRRRGVAAPSAWW